MLSQDTNPGDGKLREAYKAAYEESDKNTQSVLSALTAGGTAVVSTVNALGSVKKAQDLWRTQSLKANREAVGNMQKAEKEEVKVYLTARINAINKEIEELQKDLPSAKIFLPDVIGENGVPVSEEDLQKDPGKAFSSSFFTHLIQIGLFKPPTSEPTKDEPSPWTKARFTSPLQKS